jgi:predicted enzyme related to lactoylglutathione lyase
MPPHTGPRSPRFEAESVLADPSINILTRNVPRLLSFYSGLGFRETFRAPRDGIPTHVEVTLDTFTIGISSVEAAIADHGLHPNLDGRPIAILLWSDDLDGDYAKLTTAGARSLRPPQDFRSNLRTAWVEDPDGNPINLVQRQVLES